VRIFLSYGHHANEELVRRIKASAWEEWYQAKLAEIIRVVESGESRRFAGQIETLNGHLKPIKSDARAHDLLKKGFFGRQWLFDAVEKWRNDSGDGTAGSRSRLFWITGDPGMGKDRGRQGPVGLCLPESEHRPICHSRAPPTGNDRNGNRVSSPASKSATPSSTDLSL